MKFWPHQLTFFTGCVGSSCMHFEPMCSAPNFRLIQSFFLLWRDWLLA